MSDKKDDKKKLYSSPRWNQPLGGEVISRGKLTPEEQKQDDEVSRMFYEKVISKLKSKKDGKEDH